MCVSLNLRNGRWDGRPDWLGRPLGGLGKEGGKQWGWLILVLGEKAEGSGESLMVVSGVVQDQSRFWWEIHAGGGEGIISDSTSCG